MAVLLAGPRDAPRVVDRRRIELSDPGVEDSIQPYHAGLHTEQTDNAEVRRLTGIVERCAERSVRDLVQVYHELGYQPARIGIVAGSVIDPATIANQHIRAHAQEGRLFRTVIADAAATLGIAATIHVEREIYDIAAARLGIGAEQVRRTARDLGKGVAKPWGADEKTAAVAAWLALA